jgi:predicted negative regulator of RcsB-dependent stress response
MATYDLEEQEQLDELKTWWKMYGNMVTAVLLAMAIAALGWQGWHWWQRQQAEKASALYAVAQEAMIKGDTRRTREVAGELIDKYSGTIYAGMGALLSAKAQTEGGDLKTAQVQLGWVAEHAKDQNLRDLARLRLAAILLDQNAYDEALKQLASPPTPKLAPRFGELKGDILAAQGKTAEAAGASDAVLAELAATAKGEDSTAAVAGVYREMIAGKRDAMGGAKQ